MDNSDSEELKTDNDESPPPVGRSRASYDEADQIAQLQSANNELQQMLLHERKSSILHIHKMNALENEVTAYKNRLEAEKYECEASRALVSKLEHTISNIQKEPSSSNQEPQTSSATHSPSRTPPSVPPPPVPPSKPSKKDVNNASNNILKGLDNKTPSPAAQKKGYSRGRLRRRRASLPSINILPSFKSLKTVMGFGADEDTIDENKEVEPTTPIEKDTKPPQVSTPTLKINRSKEKNNRNSGSIENHKNDKNKSLNKKLNPKEIKQLYIKNLKLQSQIDKLIEKDKDNEFKLQEQMERCSDLEAQVALKNDVINQLNEQVLKAKNINSLYAKIQELERLLVEKDTNIQSLQVQMAEMKKKNPLTPAKIVTPTGVDYMEQYNDSSSVHSRSLTPGGYSLDPTPWSAVMKEEQKVIEKNEKEEETMVEPSAPSPPPQVSTEDRSEKRKSLSQKLSKRPSWKELQRRNILLDDPTSKQSHSLQQAHRGLHARRKSLTLDKMLVNRPDAKQLQAQNILKDGEDVDDHRGRIHKTEKGLGLLKRLAQRPSWLEVQQRGILLDDPRESHHEQAKKRRAHKRKASELVQKLLTNRPSPNELESSNIIDSNTASLFFPQSAPMSSGINTHANNPYDIDGMMDATDSLYRASVSRDKVKERLSLKLSQKPSIDNLMARGILLFRTDTKLNYDLQERHRQLHRRRASQEIEKMIQTRPNPYELETQGIMVSDATERLKAHHKKKNSMDLEAGIKRRMSLSQMQGLGLLFMDHGLELSGGEDEDYHAADEWMTDTERSQNIAGLFKQKPRSSKPLQQDVDFKGIEWGTAQEESEDDDHDASGNKAREEQEIRLADKRRTSVDNSREFEPFRLSKKAKIARIGSKLQQRPSVDDMRMRGLLYDLPSTSKNLVERKRDLMRRRASNKVEHMLTNRPKRYELENKNILLREDETLEQRKRHKRKRSLNLENAIQRRPKLMEEKEAHRQRKKSMSDSDFKPDYLSHILNDDEEEEYQQDLQQIEIRFLNVGGYVIPLVSPKFMSDLVSPNNANEAEAGAAPGDQHSHKAIEYQQDIEDLKDKLEDLEEELDEREGEIRQKDDQIKRLKNDLTMLQQETSRKSLLHVNRKEHMRDAVQHETDTQQIEKLKKEVQNKQQYIEKLSFYLLEEKGIESVPSPAQLKKEMKHKLKKRFKQRPSFQDLQRKAILTSNFINDVTNQQAQIAEKKLKIQRTSQKIGTWLPERVKRQDIEQYFVDISRKMKKDDAAKSSAAEIDFELVDNATVYELREEIGRLNEMLAEKVFITNKLEKENSNMRQKINTALDENTEILSMGLKQHSIHESKILEEISADLVRESEENQMIVTLQEKNEKLQQKIRRLSMVHDEELVIREEPEEEEKAQQEAQIHELITWSRKLSWPNVIAAIYESSDAEEPLYLMQNVIDKQRNVSRTKEQTLLREIDQLKSLQNREKMAIEKKLEMKEIEHFKDKTKLINNAMNEINRLRAELKEHGRALQLKQQQEHKQNASYLSSLWK